MNREPRGIVPKKELRRLSIVQELENLAKRKMELDASIQRTERQLESLNHELQVVEVSEDQLRQELGELD